MNKIYKNLLTAIEEMPVIDTHEHLSPFEPQEEQRDNIDVLQEYLIHYMSSDLVSAGLSKKQLETVTDPDLDLLKRWNIVEPYWEVCRYTGYGRALDLSVKKIYGLEGINRETIELLGNKFKKSKKPGHYEYVLKDLCGIELSILDAFSGRFDCDQKFFRRVWQILNYIIPMPLELPEKTPDIVAWLESEYNITINSLDDWQEAFNLELEDNLANGVIGLKNILGYFRTLKFENVNYKKAKKLFFRDFKKWNSGVRQQGINLRLSREVQDYMMHYILQIADKKELFMQIHTGLLEGNGEDITNSNPALMCNLFKKYPEVTFDIFHIGYPYYGETSALSKMFPNVFIDMCWSHIISPAASRQALRDFLDAVPYNKISAFGGDYIFVDAVYGHLQLARENVSQVLTEKVKQNIYSEEKAVEIARHLFYENPNNIFKLNH